MTSMTRSSITGLYHPKPSRTSLGSPSPSLSLLDHQSLEMKTSAVRRLLYADQSGERNSLSTVDLSKTSSSTLEQSVVQAQLKRAISCNEVMEASMKRLRTETQNAIDDLRDKNEVSTNIFYSNDCFPFAQSLERSLHEAKIKISDLEHFLEKLKQTTINSNDIVTLFSSH